MAKAKKEVLKEEEVNAGGVDAGRQEDAAAEEELPVEEEGPSKEQELEEKVKELEDQLLRKAAEFDNYRRRTTKEKEEIGSAARMKCVSELLPILDNFERALKIGCSDEEFLKGVKMIFDTMTSAFAKMGVEEIKAEGEVFNPELHYAVGRVENPELGANVIAAVMQKGYQMGGKVIRHAMVSVANAD